MEIAFDGTGGYVKVQYRSLEQFEDLVERLMGNGRETARDNYGFGSLAGQDPIDGDNAQPENHSSSTDI